LIEGKLEDTDFCFSHKKYVILCCQSRYTDNSKVYFNVPYMKLTIFMNDHILVKAIAEQLSNKQIMVHTYMYWEKWKIKILT